MQQHNENNAIGNIIVSGGSSGLGAATVRALLRRGANPLVLDKNPPRLDVPFVGVDLADTDAVEAAMSSLIDRCDGRIHGVFTAAGIDSCGALGDVPTKEWERVIHVNLL
ncbi:MAG: short-chain dehydrogenase, partial [Mycobacterium sp.]|nr:short-chain dehydrogenase [Mycobacterium sp.]